MSLDALSYDFVRQALAAGLLASVLCGVVGTLVVVKRLVFLGAGISHASFGGLGICYFLGVEPLAGAAAVAVAAALVLWRGAAPAGGAAAARSHDALIGILWAVGMALGVVFVHLTPGYAPNLMTYLFGNILTVGDRDVAAAAALVAVVLAAFALFYKEAVAVAFDEEFAAVQGVPVRLATTAILLVTALAVVFLIQLVGIILAMALLTIPPVVALLLFRRFLAVVAASTALGALMTVGGFAIAYATDLPSGPTMVLLGTAVLLVVAAARRLSRRAAAA
ncbi:MAG TPA: metal ABC transporter permease [Thermoanaerobaculia bacterium]|nr:metal ABC transporter permease [Thermoanaerobaculia bacterium]